MSLDAQRSVLERLSYRTAHISRHFISSLYVIVIQQEWLLIISLSQCLAKAEIRLPIALGMMYRVSAEDIDCPPSSLSRETPRSHKRQRTVGVDTTLMATLASLQLQLSAPACLPTIQLESLVNGSLTARYVSSMYAREDSPQMHQVKR